MNQLQPRCSRLATAWLNGWSPSWYPAMLAMCAADLRWFRALPRSRQTDQGSLYVNDGSGL